VSRKQLNISIYCTVILTFVGCSDGEPDASKEELGNTPLVQDTSGTSRDYESIQSVDDNTTDPAQENDFTQNEIEPIELSDFSPEKFDVSLGDTVSYLNTKCFQDSYKLWPNEGADLGPVIQNFKGFPRIRVSGLGAESVSYEQNFFRIKCVDSLCIERGENDFSTGGAIRARVGINQDTTNRCQRALRHLIRSSGAKEISEDLFGN